VVGWATRGARRPPAPPTRPPPPPSTPLPPPAGGTTSGLHVSGDKSLNGSGQQVRLHGADFSSFGKGNSSVLFKPYDEPHDLAWACWRDGGCTVTGSQRGARSPC
jgi:hypothetical protein